MTPPKKPAPKKQEEPPLAPGFGIPFLWPVYFFTAMGSPSIDALNENLRILQEMQKNAMPRSRPRWSTPNTVRLDLRTLTLRDFGQGKGNARTNTLVIAPYSGNSSVMIDIQPDQSLVRSLMGAGVRGVVAVDWKSATPNMKELDIDSYLEELNVCVDELGGKAVLVGLSQGGWFSAMYAARFPEKVRALVLAGAPIDSRAGGGAVKKYVDRFPMTFFEALVASGGGLLKGGYMLQGLRSARPGEMYLDRYLKLYEHINDKEYVRSFEQLEKWFSETLDLPGRWYLQVVKEIFKENKLFRGSFVALGKRLDLHDVKCPAYLLAGEWDDIAPKEQVFNAAERLGTRKADITRDEAKAEHFGLFMSSTVLTENWARVGRWIAARSR